MNANTIGFCLQTQKLELILRLINNLHFLISYYGHLCDAETWLIVSLASVLQRFDFILVVVVFFLCLLQMSAREDIDFQGQEIKSNLDEVESKLEAKLECVQQKLDALLERLGNKELNE